MLFRGYFNDHVYMY